MVSGKHMKLAGFQEVLEIAHLIHSQTWSRMLQVVNWASICMNQSAGSFGQKGSSLIWIAATAGSRFNDIILYWHFMIH